MTSNLHKSNSIMYIPEEIKTEAVNDRIKQTLGCEYTPIYEWMFDTGLHQCDLLVYAALFNELRRYPKTPMYVSMSDIARKIHYSPSSVAASVDMLVEHGFIYRRGERTKTLYSIYPFNTLDLK